METVTTRNVNGIPSAERRALETLLGKHLDADQQVFVMAYKPNTAPDANVRATARQHLQETFAAIDRHGDAHNITSDEADAAIDEALEQIRPRVP